MEQILVVGHKNPDNDSISSAICYAAFKQALNDRERELDPSIEPVEYKPVCLGPIPTESAWILDRFGFDAPEFITHVEPGCKLALVDHNEYQQAVDGIDHAEIVELVDHHRIGSFTTARPVQCITFPWGCTATIIAFLYDAYELEIPPSIAAVLLGAILTDTVIFKSPTTTKTDIQTAEKLAEIAGLEVESFGMEIFESRGGVEDLDVHTLVCADSKEFPVSTGTILIAQRETVAPQKILAREEEIRAYMKDLASKHKYEYVLFLVTDILNEGSYFLVEGDPSQVDRVFDIQVPTGSVWIPGVLSRKKQVAAPILADNA